MGEGTGEKGQPRLNSRSVDGSTANSRRSGGLRDRPQLFEYTLRAVVNHIAGDPAALA